MSRILRRPMFRGGSINEGIMSVPRKQYEGAGSVDGFENEDELAANENLLDSGTITTKPAGLTISDSGIDLNKYNAAVKDVVQSKGITADKLKDLSTSDIMLAEYLGNRPDPLGKFLIQFGLNYMSATPKGGKFGALATAAESAKKPTEQLYADIDTDRLLKLKLMSALGKSESKVALEKEARFMVQNNPEKYPDLKTAMNALLKGRLERKETSVEDRINEEYKAIRSKSVSSGSEIRDMNKAQILQRDKNKLKDEVDKLASTNTFGIPDNITKLPNSTDYSIPNAKKNDLDSFKVGRIYVDADTRMSFEYLGNNIFRPKIRL